MSDILFDQPIVSTVADIQRLSVGTPITQAENVTFANFKTQLNNQLSFLRPANNLSELIPTAGVARANLGVPSISDLSTKASIDHVNSQDTALGVSITNVNNSVNDLSARFQKYTVHVPIANWTLEGDNTIALCPIVFPSLISSNYVAFLIPQASFKSPFTPSIEYQNVEAVVFRLVVHEYSIPIIDIFDNPIPDADLYFDVLIVIF